MKILIAENDENICILYKYALADKHDLIICNTSESCIDQFNNYNLNNLDSKKRRKNSFFDIVLLDYQLPGLNGIEIAKELIKKNPNQRIIHICFFKVSIKKHDRRC